MFEIHPQILLQLYNLSYGSIALPITKNTWVLKIAIYMLLLHFVVGNVFYFLPTKNTIKFEKEEQWMIMMGEK